MGKFKNKHGHTRWQEGRKDIKNFIDKHGDEIGPFVKAIAKVAVPRAGMAIEAIEEIRQSKAPKETREKAMKALGELIDDLDDDPLMDDQQSYTAVDPIATNSGDIAKVINSTWASKFIMPVVLVLVTILFFGLWATEIGFYWGLCPTSVRDSDKFTISTVFGTMIGLRQIIRGEMKKKIIQA